MTSSTVTQLVIGLFLLSFLADHEISKINLENARNVRYVYCGSVSVSKCTFSLIRVELKTRIQLTELAASIYRNHCN